MAYGPLGCNLSIYSMLCCAILLGCGMDQALYYPPPSSRLGLLACLSLTYIHALCLHLSPLVFGVSKARQNIYYCLIQCGRWQSEGQAAQIETSYRSCGDITPAIQTASNIQFAQLGSGVTI